MKFVKTYNVPALSCHDCANHVIENLVKFSFIEEVHIDFDNSNITLTCSKEISDEQALDIINDILVDHHCEDHSFGHLHHVMTEVFGLDIGCDVCAKEVEKELNKEKDIIDAEVNYEKKKVIIKHLNNVEIYDIYKPFNSRDGLKFAIKFHKHDEIIRIIKMYGIESISLDYCFKNCNSC